MRPEAPGRGAPQPPPQVCRPARPKAQRAALAAEAAITGRGAKGIGTGGEAERPAKAQCALRDTCRGDQLLAAGLRDTDGLCFSARRAPTKNRLFQRIVQILTRLLVC